MYSAFYLTCSCPFLKSGLTIVRHFPNRMKTNKKNKKQKKKNPKNI